METNQKTIGILVVIGLVIISGGLIILARGGSYDLKTLSGTKGPEGAPILIEEFSDFECPACKANAPIIAAALKDFPTQVRFVYKDFPLGQHTSARPAAAAALCAAQQDKFFEYHDKVFEDQRVWAGSVDSDSFFVNLAVELGLDINSWEECRSSRTVRQAIQDDINEGTERGVDSTPTFFVNGNKVEAPTSVFGWITAIEKELEKQGLTSENKADEPITDDEEVEED